MFLIILNSHLRSNWTAGYRKIKHFDYNGVNVREQLAWGISSTWRSCGSSHVTYRLSSRCTSVEAKCSKCQRLYNLCEDESSLNTYARDISEWQRLGMRKKKNFLQTDNVIAVSCCSKQSSSHGAAFSTIGYGGDRIQMCDWKQFDFKGMSANMRITPDLSYWKAAFESYSMCIGLTTAHFRCQKVSPGFHQRASAWLLSKQNVSSDLPCPFHPVFMAWEPTPYVPILHFIATNPQSHHSSFFIHFSNVGLRVTYFFLFN